MKKTSPPTSTDTRTHTKSSTARSLPGGTTASRRQTRAPQSRSRTLSFPRLGGHRACGDDGRCWEDVQMPRPHPPEFRQRAVELARLREKPVAKIAEDLGISESCLRNWIRQADIDDGGREGLTSSERAELVELRRDLRVTKMENEILKRAAAFFARENVLPK